MLFNSYEFLFMFLPLFLLAWWLVAAQAKSRLPLLLLGASALFYGLWGLPFFVLLLGMICMNYALGLMLQAMPDKPLHNDTPRPLRRHFWTRKTFLGLAILLNLTPLCYFKYSSFILQNINSLLGTTLHAAPTALPLGISFYTFMQIAWLVTIYRRQVKTEKFTDYALFSSCFPYVISGPIVRYEQVAPQFANLDTLKAHNVAPGLTVFCLGLAKKVLLADSLAAYANSIFNAAEKGFPLTGAEAWAGSLAYTFQLYFDFSGYTDMAIGIALLIGLRLPDNFDSPYKSTGIVDFWRRWHITLSSWLRDFLYIPLGGSRTGKFKQYRNLFLTMLLGGVWHGAGWPFVVWGAAHGAMLSINHFFKSWAKGRIDPLFLNNPLSRLCSIILTFLCLNAAWVVFRAESMTGALRLYEKMFLELTIHGNIWQSLFTNRYMQDLQCPLLLLLCGIITWGLPNTREIVFGRAQGKPWLAWSPSLRWAFAMALLALASLVLLSRKSVFLYFQF